MNQTEKRELVSQIDNLRESKGLSVKDACKAYGINQQAYYIAKRVFKTNGNTPKQTVSPKPRTQSGGFEEKDAVLNALYQHVDFKTFQAVESNWV